MSTEITQPREFASAPEAEAVAAQSRAAEVVAKLATLRAFVRDFFGRSKLEDRLTLCEKSFGNLDGYKRFFASDGAELAVGLRLAFKFKELPPSVTQQREFASNGFYSLYRVFQSYRAKKSCIEMEFVVVDFAVNRLFLAPVLWFDGLCSVLKDREYAKVDDETPKAFMQFLRSNLKDTDMVKNIASKRALLVSVDAAASALQSYVAGVTARGFFGPDTFFPQKERNRVERAQKAAASDAQRMRADQGVGVAQAVEAAVQSMNLRHKPLTPAEVEQRSLDGLIHCLTHAQSTYVADLDPGVCRVVLESMVKATQAGHGGLGLRDDKVQLANFLATTRLAEVESGRGFGDLTKEINDFLTASVLRNRAKSNCRTGDFADFVGREAPHAPLMSAALAEFSQMDALVHGLSGLLQVPPAPELPPPGTTAEALSERVASKGSYDFKERPVAPPTPQQLELGLQVAAEYVARAYDPQHPFATCAEGAQLYLELAADPVVAPFACGRGVFGAAVLATRAHPGSQEVRGAFLALAQAFLDDPKGRLNSRGIWVPPAELVLAVHAAARAARDASEAKVSRKRGRGKKK